MIPIGGVQKTSLIDFPGRVSCVLFLGGCNFHCPYCHNPDLVDRQAPSIFESTESVFEFLDQRRSLLDGVVISGGEPTIHKGLAQFCTQVKQLGYAVKLDTNGSRPEALERLLAADVIDYVAMDIKTDPDSYYPLLRSEDDPQAIRRSTQLLLRRAPYYEFRTTCVRPFVDPSRFEIICRCIEGAQLYVLQQFQRGRTLTPEFFDNYPDQYGDTDLPALKAVADNWVQTCRIR